MWKCKESISSCLNALFCLTFEVLHPYLHVFLHPFVSTHRGLKGADLSHYRENLHLSTHSLFFFNVSDFQLVSNFHSGRMFTAADYKKVGESPLSLLLGSHS